jgi:hypothetical protein
MVLLFNPRTQVWSEHFRWTEDGLRIAGLTPVGRVTVVALHLSDDPDALMVRSYWVLAGWHHRRISCVGEMWGNVEGMRYGSMKIRAYQQNTARRVYNV